MLLRPCIHSNAQSTNPSSSVVCGREHSPNGNAFVSSISARTRLRFYITIAISPSLSDCRRFSTLLSQMQFTIMTVNPDTSHCTRHNGVHSQPTNCSCKIPMRDLTPGRNFPLSVFVKSTFGLLQILRNTDSIMHRFYTTSAISSDSMSYRYWF